MHSLAPTELADWLATGQTSFLTMHAKPYLLDVREEWETELAQIPGSVTIGLAKLPESHAFLDSFASKETPIVCICHHGVRSAHAARFLKEQGFSNVFNLQGGIHAWAHDVDRGMKTY